MSNMFMNFTKLFMFSSIEGKFENLLFQSRSKNFNTKTRKCELGRGTKFIHVCLFLLYSFSKRVKQPRLSNSQHMLMISMRTVITC